MQVLVHLTIICVGYALTCTKVPEVDSSLSLDELIAGFCYKFSINFDKKLLQEKPTRIISIMSLACFRDLATQLGFGSDKLILGSTASSEESLSA